MLVLEDVAIQLKSQILLQVNAVIKPGEIVTLMGPSGVGKSSVLAAIAGLLPETFRLSGKIILNQHNITNMPAHLRHTGLLYQDALLFEHLDVTGNIVFAMPGKKHRDKKQYARQLLEQVGLGEMAQRPVSTLSGGQASRVSLVRTLASEPAALLLDEPFSKLDSATRHSTRQWVFEKIREAGLPALLVTHDEEDAAATGDKIIKV
ncbi:ATP-binding cassette domain-containing protein [Alteromonas lipotrueiana]|uniref:ATP-binding cassette domain-containing protein n=1 Tax=Alteromonas lipotrueiana TaxID=2803815 RepID=UPI001C46A7BB